MKKSLGPKTILYPHPVLLVGSYDEEGRPNLMTVSWGGICNSQPPSLAVSVRKATYTYASLLARKAFTVGVPSEEHLKGTDYCGIYSGREGDKFAAAGFTPVRSDRVDAPYAAECPLVLECRLLHATELGLHTQFIGEIVDVKADEEALTDKGLPDIEKVRPFLYSTGNGNYYGVGARLAKAFSAGRKS